jgi:hypothetical protein
MDGVPGCRCFFRIAHSKKSADSLFVDHFQGFDYRWTEGLETSISPLAKIVIEGIVPDFSRSRNRALEPSPRSINCQAVTRDKAIVNGQG